MPFKTTANHHVKVKLTEYGIAILKEQHDELNRTILSNGGKGLGEFNVPIDEEGYYRTQVWSLMNRFGHVMYPGCEEPFDINNMIFDAPKER